MFEDVPACFWRFWKCSWNWPTVNMFFFIILKSWRDGLFSLHTWFTVPRRQRCIVLCHLAWIEIMCMFSEAPGCGTAGVHTCIDLNGNTWALVYQWIAFGVLSGLQLAQLWLPPSLYPQLRSEKTWKTHSGKNREPEVEPQRRDLSAYDKSCRYNKFVCV